MKHDTETLTEELKVSRYAEERERERVQERRFEARREKKKALIGITKILQRSW
jgi:hypothetical protein